MRRIFLIAFLFSVTAFISWGAFAEQITITTYYPAPYGVYRDLRTETLTVLNDNEEIAIGRDTDNPAIELRDLDGSGGIPYIDFSNDAGVDYDMRIILGGDNELNIIGGASSFPTLTISNENGTPGIIRTEQVWYCSSY